MSQILDCITQADLAAKVNKVGDTMTGALDINIAGTSIDWAAIDVSPALKITYSYNGGAGVAVTNSSSGTKAYAAFSAGVDDANLLQYGVLGANYTPVAGDNISEPLGSFVNAVSNGTMAIGSSFADTNVLLYAGGLSTTNKALLIDGTTQSVKIYKALNEAAEVTIASASTVDIGAAASNNIAISGTTTITSFGNADAGIRRSCRATGAFKITYNATTLITSNSKDITTKANDSFEMESLGSGNWIMTNFSPADGRIMANAVNNQTGTTYTFAITDLGNDVTANNAAASTYTLPQTSNIAFPIGSKIKLINLGVGTVTLVKEGAETLLGNTTLITNATCFIEKISATSWQVFAGTSVVVECFNIVFSGTLTNDRVYDIAVPNFNGTITGLTLRNTSATTAGTYTAKIDGTNITGLAAIANSTTRTLTSATAANTFTSGQVISYVPTGMTSVVDAFITLYYTRSY